MHGVRWRATRFACFQAVGPPSFAFALIFLSSIVFAPIFFFFPDLIMYAYSALASASHRICIIAQKKQDFFYFYLVL